MFGQLLVDRSGWGTVRRGELYGLPVLRAKAGLDSWMGELRLQRAGRSLWKAGASRTLVPAGFRRWEALEACGLRPIDLGPFLRAQSVPLALEALEHRGLDPSRTTVALRGTRAGRDMLRTAAALCPQVRRLVIAAPQGGAELASWLRWEFGIPILPPAEQGEVALRFSPGPAGSEEPALELYGPSPDLAGLTLTAPALAQEDSRSLPLLAALWEGGRLSQTELKIT